MDIRSQILVAIMLGLKRNWHILFGLLAGIAVGIFMPAQNYPLIHKIIDFIGQTFIGIIQMVVIPLVISTIVIGISSIGDNKMLARFGKKMIFYYAVITCAAVGIGTALALVFKPGESAQPFIDANVAQSLQATVQAALQDHNSQLSAVFLSLIPKNPFAALANGELIPIMIFLIIFAIALAKVGEMNRPVISFFESIFAATMKVTDWIVFLAAPGVFALTASAVGNFGLSMFTGVWKYAAVVVATLFLMFFVLYPIVLKIFSKVPVGKLYNAITEALMVAFGTASSSATLPLTIARCEKYGISNKVASFVLPLGATLSMDGTAAVQTIAVLFLTQAYGIVLDPLAILQVAFLAIIASSTCAGIPGAGLITIALVLNGLGLTPEQLVSGFAFLFALDRLFDMFRTVTNVASDAVVAAIIADNENELDYDLLNSVDTVEE